jgi:hypothetical protein
MASPKLASDVDNADFVGARNPDDSLWVKFEERKFLNEFKTEQEGHPIFEMREFITIRSPGDPLTVIDTFVTEKHKARFPRQWAHYKNTHENVMVDGWAIDSWPMVTSAQAEEFKYRKFQTVEQLAEAPFNIIQTMGMGYIELQEKAKIALKNAKDGSFAIQQAAELKKRDDQIAAMQSQIAQLVLLAEKQHIEPEKKKSGRPAKQKDEVTE